LRDKDSGVSTSDFNSANTNVNTEASQDVADRLLYEAINYSANEWFDLDKAILRLEEERKKARLIYSKK
jgi:hypothetical protein